MKKLKVVKLKELGAIVGGGTPSTIVEEYYNGDISWITPKDLSGYNSKYISKGERSITRLGLDKSNAVLLPPKTILISSRAPIGYIVISTKELSTNQGFKSVIPNKNVVNTEYLYYLLSLNSDRLKNIGTGTTFKEVSKKVMEDFEMRIIEDVNEQEKIANLLSALDNKIELNNQMNKDLEEMAQTLYTKWFVNFDFPNEKGKPYKSSGGEMIDSELGEIPAGWRVGKMIDYFDFAKGIEVGSSNYLEKSLDDTVRFIRVGDMESLESNVYTYNYLTKNIVCAPNDVLISMDGSVGRVVNGLNGCYSSGIRNVVSKDELFNSKGFIYLLLKSERTQYTINKFSHGSIIKHAGKSISHLEFIVPNKEYMIAFKNIVEPLYTKIVNNKLENQQLKETRDLLLPYLMSGKIDLGE